MTALNEVLPEPTIKTVPTSKTRKSAPAKAKALLTMQDDPHNYLRELINAQRTCGSRGAGSRSGAMAEAAAKLLAEMSKVRAAISEYYTALDKREHGGIASIRAFDKIQNALGMHWEQKRG